MKATTLSILSSSTASQKLSSKSIVYYPKSLFPTTMKPTSALVTIVALLGGHAASLPTEPSTQNNAREITDVQSRKSDSQYHI